MSWSILQFGNHKGKTLPQVVFSDPDWFFWAIEKDVFKNKGKIFEEAQEIERKSKRIKIPQASEGKLVAEYAIHPPSKKFGDLEILPSSRPTHEGSTPTFRLEHIDLSVPRQMAPYDKLGCKHLISNLKYYLFGGKSYKMTKDRCDAFFEDDDNFDL